MTPRDWLRQTDKPAFPDILWSRPVTSASAGKLLIIGGNAAGFAAPAKAFAAAGTAGIGVARVLLPDVLKKSVRLLFELAWFSPSTPSGSFARQGSAEWQAEAEWAEGVLLAGDFGKNSETAVLLEQFVGSYTDKLLICGDAVDYFFSDPAQLLNRPATTLICSAKQLQKLGMGMSPKQIFSLTEDLAPFAGSLAELSLRCAAAVVTWHAGQTIVACDGRLSVTMVSRESAVEELAAFCATFWIQQPKTFEALTTAAFVYKEKVSR